MPSNISWTAFFFIQALLLLLAARLLYVAEARSQKRESTSDSDTLMTLGLGQAEFPWAELHFEMNVPAVRLGSFAALLAALVMSLMAYGMALNHFPVPIWLEALMWAGVCATGGLVLWLSCFPRWQSRVVLEMERLVIYPSFGRQPRIIYYTQISRVRGQWGNYAVWIHYYLQTFDGQLDLKRRRELKLPSTAENERLRLALQARRAGPPLESSAKSRPGD
jgi:hypothetical protein